jgi:hypothetical protein
MLRILAAGETFRTFFRMQKMHCHKKIKIGAFIVFSDRILSFRSDCRSPEAPD